MDVLWREPLYSSGLERDVADPDSLLEGYYAWLQAHHVKTALTEPSNGQRTVTNTPFYAEQLHNHRLSHRLNCEVAFDPAVRTITIEILRRRDFNRNGPTGSYD